MTDSALQAFAKDGISVESGPGGFDTFVLRHDGARARVSTHGAHLFDYQPRDRPGVLWLSPEAVFDAGRAIRGGIPICWPWFADHPSDPTQPAHGFVRTRSWTPIDSRSDTESKSVTLALSADAQTWAIWPFAFELRYRIELTDRLEASLRILNTGDVAMPFSAALHSYFAISDISNVTVEGLAGRDYLDKLEAYARFRQAQTPISIDQEIDRIYLDTEDTCTVHDAGRNVRLRIGKSGSRSTVVWNPWQDKSRRLSDFPADGYRSMLCVETANAAEDARELAAGARHELRVVLRVESS